jgi:hypothetical protein
MLQAMFRVQHMMQPPLGSSPNVYVAFGSLAIRVLPSMVPEMAPGAGMTVTPESPSSQQMPRSRT